MMIVCRTGTGSFEFQTALHLHTWLYLKIYLCLSAPVLEPAISQLCLSPEQKIISCSSEGDEPEFMLFLDDNLLLQTTTKSTEKHSISKVTITLHAQLMGKLACIVQNNVSRRQKIILITSCTGNYIKLFNYILYHYFKKIYLFDYCNYVTAILCMSTFWFPLIKKNVLKIYCRMHQY